MKPIRIGVIGYGGIGKAHTMAYMSIPMYSGGAVPVKLVGVCSSQESNCKLAMESAPFEWSTVDYRELLSSPEIDAVSICAPNHLHRPMLIEAIRQGKHIYAEKPLALNVADAQPVMDELAGRPVITGMAFEYRFIPAILRAKQLLDEGMLGSIFHFRFTYHRSRYVNADLPASWRTQREFSGGGALADLGSHLIDLIGHLLGEVGAVSATQHTFVPQRKAPGEPDRQVAVDVDDYASVQIRMAGGAVGSLEASRYATGKANELSFEIFGSRGSLRFNLNDPNYLDYFTTGSPSQPIGGLSGFTAIQTIQRYPEGNLEDELSGIGWMRPHIASQLAFLKAVTSGTPHRPGLEDGYRVQQVLDAAYQSAEREEWVKV